MSEVKNIFVTDGNSRAALTITRSLGSKGYNVFVGERNNSSLASNSKYCTKAIEYPDPGSQHSKFCKSIKNIISQYDIDLVIPVTDICVFPISKMAKDGEISCIAATSDIEALRLAADKSELLSVAKELGLNVPSSDILAKKDNVQLNNLNTTYPIVVKPSRSRVMINGKWVYTSVSYAHNQAELQKILSSIQTEVFPVVLQERIYGHGVGAFYCYDNGQCVAKFAHKRLREKPPSGGVSVLRESVELDPLVDEHSQKLLSYLNWHGVAMVEYKYDVVKKLPYLMEINGRFWGSLQLAVDAGVDFPNYLVNISKGSKIEQDKKYKIGVKTRWFWGDVDLLLLLLFKSRKQLDLPKDYGPKWKVIIAILKPFGKDMKYEVLKINDIKPWLFETKQWFRKIVNRYIRTN